MDVNALHNICGAFFAICLTDSKNLNSSEIKTLYQYVKVYTN
jgi:hypothetical protein